MEESNLARHIYLLRKMLRDFGESEDLVQTVPRRGYRFAGDVNEIHEAEVVFETHTVTQTLIEEVPAACVATGPDRSESKNAPLKGKAPFKSSSRRVGKVLIPAAILATVLATVVAVLQLRAGNPTRPSSIKSIAVLPFKDLAAGRNGERNGLAMADLLISRLSKIRALNVRPTSAVADFNDQAVDVTSVGRELQVDAVMRGTIYRATDRVRVTAHLFKVSDRSSIWEGEFEKPSKDELLLQDEIALQVVDALALNLSGNEQKELTKRYTGSADAYRLYVNGRYQWNKRNNEGLAEAERLFRNAIERDPNFALAYVGLADMMAFSYRETEMYPAINKALELDPNLAAAYATQGFAQSIHEWNWKEAEQSFKRSIELDPGYATAHRWYATLLAIEGRLEEATNEMQRALEINPLSHNFLADLGEIYYFAREYDKAREYCQKALDIYPGFAFAHRYLSHIYLQTGDYEAAIEEIYKEETAAITLPSLRSEDLEAEARVLNEWRAIYRRGGIREFYEYHIARDRNVSQGASQPYVLAWFDALLGDKRQALDNLERAFESRGFLMAWVNADPVFDSLREEPRYRALLRRMGLPPRAPATKSG